MVNTDTGKVYETIEEQYAARERGENLVPISQRVAELLSFGRKERTKQLRNKRKSRRRQGFK